MSAFKYRISYFTEKLVRFLVVENKGFLRLEMGLVCCILSLTEISLLAAWVDLSGCFLEDCWRVLKYYGATKITYYYFLPKWKISSKP